jgi:hypothetical protein
MQEQAYFFVDFEGSLGIEMRKVCIELATHAYTQNSHVKQVKSRRLEYQRSAQHNLPLRPCKRTLNSAWVRICQGLPALQIA